MGCVKTVVPWIIDPVGMAIQKTTGFSYTPGGFANTALNPPSVSKSRPAPTPQAPPPPPPPPPPPWHPAPMKAQEPSPRSGHEGTGASASSDTTRGLLKNKGGAGRSLLG